MYIKESFIANEIRHSQNSNPLGISSPEILGGGESNNNNKKN
jgi:hypothetical protein